MVKGDLFVQSKHADRTFEGPNGAFSIFWYSTPTHHKTLNVEYIPSNYPVLTVTIKSNTKSMTEIQRLKRSIFWKEIKGV